MNVAGGEAMSLTTELSGLIDKEIAITMKDGMIYRGILKKFDKDTIVLEDIYEASNKDVNWVETRITSEDGKKVKAVKGYIHWRKITLPKLIMRVPMVLRLWPWELE